MTVQDRALSFLQRWPILLGILALLAIGESRAQEWYLKIDGVPGELKEGRFAGWSRVQGVGVLAGLPVNPTNGTAGPASFSCEINKAIDGTSAFLLKNSNDAIPCRRMSLACALTPSNAPQYRITLEDVLVASIVQEGSANGLVSGIVEKVAVNFQKIEWACFTLDTEGGIAEGLTARINPITGESDLKSRPPFRASITRQDGRSGVLITCPVEKGHAYRILSRATFFDSWKMLLEFTASEDGTSRQFVPTDAPALFMRVEEVD